MTVGLGPAALALALGIGIGEATPSPAPAAVARAGRARWHFVFDGQPSLEYSLLFSRSDERRETRLLVRADAGRFDLVSAQSGGEHDSLESVRDGDSGETFARRLLFSRYESVAGCAGVTPPDACILFTGSRGSVSTSMAAFAGEGAASLRERIAATLSPALKSRLHALAPVFARSVEFDPYTKDFLGLVWPERFDGRRSTVSDARRGKGCAFDEAFGYPCSEAERQREKTKFGAR